MADEQDRKDRAAIREVARKFLQAIMDGEDWRPYAQQTFREARVQPNIPVFRDFEVGRTQRMAGANDKVFRAVYVKMQLGPSSIAGIEWIEARLTAVKESAPYTPDPNGEWGICPTSWTMVR